MLSAFLYKPFGVSGHLLKFPLSILVYLGVEFLGHRVGVHLA